MGCLIDDFANDSLIDFTYEDKFQASSTFCMGVEFASQTHTNRGLTERPSHWHQLYSHARTINLQSARRHSLRIHRMFWGEIQHLWCGSMSIRKNGIPYQYYFNQHPLKIPSFFLPFDRTARNPTSPFQKTNPWRHTSKQVSKNQCDGSHTHIYNAWIRGTNCALKV